MYGVPEGPKPGDEVGILTTSRLVDPVEITPLDLVSMGINGLVGTANLAQKSLPGKGLVGDTGATLMIIGADHMNDVVNVRDLEHPILLKTANSTLILTQCGDLPKFKGLIDGVAINGKSPHSLLPIIPICKKLQCSFEVSTGGEFCRFVTNRIKL